MMKTNRNSMLLSSVILALGLNITACTKQETAETHKTEDIAAHQGEMVKASNPAPTASQPATPVPTSTVAAASTVTATASSVTIAADNIVASGTTTATASAVTTAAAGGSDVGEKLYASNCKTCHEGGLAGAPKFGDAAAWKDRIAQGKDTLYTHAIQGFQGKAGVMPPKGGSMASDDEVKAAVDYMVAKSS